MKIIETILGAFQVALTILLSPILRSWYNRWGASDQELVQPLPGDELVPSYKLGYTRAITIQAPVEHVWPWIAQMGQGRGGLYSYEGLENLIGCEITSSDKILPQFQNPQPGDLIRLGKKGYPCFSVAAVESPDTLVLVSANPQTEIPGSYSDKSEKGFSIATWQWALHPLGSDSTRLMVRQRLDFSQDMAVIWRITEPIGFVMERKMLKSIRDLARSGKTLGDYHTGRDEDQL